MPAFRFPGRPRHVVRLAAPALLAGLVIAGGVAPAAAFADTVTPLPDPGTVVTDPTTTVATAPDSPATLTVEPADGAVTVSWTPPANDGGSAIDAYDVSVTPLDPSAVPTTTSSTDPSITAVDAATTSVTIGDLANGVAYSVSVEAVNLTGPSLPAVVSATPRTVPGAAVVAAVGWGDASATVRWSAPVDDGGAPITGYVVTALPSEQAVSVGPDDTAATVDGLANGVPTTVTVAAVNAAGAGQPVSTQTVTPRMSGRIGVVTNPASLVTYGTASQVTAAVTSATGAALPGQRLDLYYRIGTGSWHAVASGLTGSTGRVSLRAVLPASASLLLKHPLGAVTAANVAPRYVHVARRVTTSAHHGITVGQTIVTTGSVAPSRAIGARVSLLRYVSGSWRTVAYGRMTTHTAYRVAYKPTVAGTYVLRTSVPSDATHSAGYGASWKQAVARETVAMVASAILHNTHITLATVHESGVSDGATARDDMLALAAGRLAPRSAYQNAPGGSTSVTIGLLRALRALGTKARVTVSEIAGGSHAVGSSHYYGKAMDITVVNGVSISAGGNYSLVASICRSYGATTVYDPAYDPYGGHGNHVHCQWGSGRD